MFLLVPAHPGFPGQIPQSRKTVVCVCVCGNDNYLLSGPREYWRGCDTLTTDNNACITNIQLNMQCQIKKKKVANTNNSFCGNGTGFTATGMGHDWK